LNLVRQDSDYALRVMVALAVNHGEKPLSARELSRQSEVSYQFTCKILQQLHEGGLVESVMGPKGGYRLSREPTLINVAHIIETVQGPVSLNKCMLGLDACPRRVSCTISGKLEELQQYVNDFFTKLTLAELAQSVPPHQVSINCP
jgi:Rrf2 family protein